MALIEGEWLTPSEAAFDGGRLRATGAVLFATLETPRLHLVRSLGSWPAVSPIERERRGIAASAARAANWLLGR